MPWRQYLSAASLLLAATLGMGVYFGDQQEELAQMLLLAGRQAELTRATEFARETLEELRLAQDVFARADLDHDPSTGWALDLETLRAAIAAMPVSERERYGYGAMSVWGTWPPRGWYRYSVEVVDGAPCLVAERRFDAPLLPRLVCYPQGRIAREE